MTLEPLKLDTIAGLPQWPAIDADTGVPIDGQARYLIPVPGERERRGWQRCTTLASTLADRFALEIHAQNALLLGLGARADLRDLATVVKRDDRVALRKLRGDALAAGGADVKANHGSAFHELSRPLDWAHERGMLAQDANMLISNLDTDQRARYGSMVRAYANALVHYGISMPDGIGQVRTGDPTELVFHDPRIKVAGRLDKIRKIAGRNVIVDLKTGDDPMKYGGVEIAMQLAICAHAPFYWYETAGEHGPALQVDRETAYVLHVPNGGDFAELIAVDIAQAWRWVYLALQVRDLRSRALESYAMPMGRVGAHETIRAPGAGAQPGRVWPWQGSQAAAVATGLAIGLPPVEPVAAPTPVPPLPDGSEVRVLVQGGQRVENAATAPAPAAVPPATEAPAAGGAEQATEVKRQRACGRCRRPGHQARSCTFVTAVARDGSGQLTPIIDERTTTLIATGKASDAENVTPNNAVSEPAGQAPPWCTCTNGWEYGWSNRGDGVWVHMAPHCGKPNYAAGARATAAEVLRTGGDDAGMARQALDFFTANPDFLPPQKVIDSGWPPAPPVTNAGETSMSVTPVLSTPGMTDSQAISTAPPVTTATPVPSPGPTPTASPQQSIPAGAPVADFSRQNVAPADWPHYLSTAATLGQLTERVQQAITAGAWDETATRAAMTRRGEL